ncbi:MAG TPA: hypothetical protein DCW31_01235 [Lactobacillus sp.]|nr:hypothetical protein [Lactobacillus sp.]
MNFYPYLTFTGQAEAALKFYQTILGGQLSLQRAGDLFPDADETTAPLIVHGVLSVLPTFQIVALDVIPGAPTVTPGATVSMGIHSDSEHSGQKLFDQLGVNGEVVIPFDKKSWGGAFGIVTDKFGVRWNIDA